MINQKDQVLKRAKVALDNMVEKARNQRNEEDRKFLVSKIGEDLAVILVPLLEEIAVNARMSKEDISGLVNQIKTEIAKVQIEMPEIKMPDIFVPEPKVTVNVPEIKLPVFNLPEVKMPDKMEIEGWVGLMGVSLEKPLPVQLRNPDGSPFSFDNINLYSSGGSAGRGVVKISGYDSSAFGNMLNPDGRLRVETNDSGGSTTIVDQVSGSIWSVKVTSFDTSVAATIIDSSGVGYSGSNPVPISGTVSATDLDIRDLNVGQDEILVHQVSGANWSVNVPGTVAVTQSGTWDEVGINDSGNSITVDATDLDIRDLNVTQDELLVHQVSGASWSVSLSTALSDTTDTIGTQQVSGAIDSVQTKLIARQTNPAAASDTASNFATSDDLGRTLVRPVQVRDLIITAYATFATGTEATLLTGTAATYNDLIYILASNNSSVAVGIDIRPSTAGSIVMHLEIPANGVVGVSTPVPIPQQATGDGTGGTWTVDLPDVTGTTVSVSALFTREI